MLLTYELAPYRDVEGHTNSDICDGKFCVFMETGECM
jgi:hypothetical protein